MWNTKRTSAISVVQSDCGYYVTYMPFPVCAPFAASTVAKFAFVSLKFNKLVLFQQVSAYNARHIMMLKSNSLFLFAFFMGKTFFSPKTSLTSCLRVLLS
jgi:hypothetical protein